MRVPTLETNADKSEVLKDAFVLGPVSDIAQHAEADYADPKFKYKPITNTQIRHAISWLGLYKAAGADTIANIIFIQCTDLLVPHLGPLYRATFSLRVYPSQWKDSTTIVLKKPAKPDYTLLNAYQLIVLLSTIAKILSAYIPKDLVHMEEVHKLLPDKHFGCSLLSFSPNPYCSHFLFFSIYFSYFSFMQAFATNWSLL